MSTPRSRSAEPVETGVPLLQVRLVTPEQDFRVPAIDLYRSADDWSGLYVDGRLAAVGHDEDVLERLLRALDNVRCHASTQGGGDFMRGSESTWDVARTTADIDAYRHAQGAARLREEAAALCAQADRLDAEAAEGRS